MADMGKELERSRDKVVTDGATLVSAEVMSHRLASKINGVRERSKGGEADQRAAVDRAEVAAGRERAEAKRLHDSLEEDEAQRDGLVNDLQEFRRAEDNFNRRMKYLGVRGDERERLVTSDIEELRGIFDSLEGILRRPDQRRKTRGGEPPNSRSGADWRRNRYRT